jgi:hypothetical protein
MFFTPERTAHIRNEKGVEHLIRKTEGNRLHGRQLIGLFDVWTTQVAKDWVRLRFVMNMDVIIRFRRRRGVFYKLSGSYIQEGRISGEV